MTHHSSSLCQKALQLPLYILGVSLFVVSFLGLIGSCCEKTFWIKIYSCFNILLIVGLICFTIFTFVVTNKGAGKVLSKIGYREYRLGDYSNWLKNHFVNQKNWDQIRSCLIDAHVCHDIHSGVNQQSGCCKPPTNCGFEYKNATFWIAPGSGPDVQDSDCTTWSNNQNKYCYDCNSCKGGFLATIKKEWRILAIVLIFVTIFLIILYSLSCCAIRSIHQSHSKYSKFGP
ncbi:tetraspanin [Salix suchowensis]|nr:tetraspanin [Salix suchowensis]